MKFQKLFSVLLAVVLGPAGFAQAWLGSPVVGGSVGGSTAVTSAGSLTGATLAANVVNASLNNITPVGGTLAVAGSLSVAASTTALASLNVPHGVDPTAPVNGDIWTTAAGAFARINGVTVSLGGVSGSGTVTTVSVVTANGISGSVATATTTPAITLTLGAITPTSVTATGIGTFTAAILNGLGSNLTVITALSSTLVAGGYTQIYLGRAASAGQAAVIKYVHQTTTSTLEFSIWGDALPAISITRGASGTLALTSAGAVVVGSISASTTITANSGGMASIITGAQNGITLKSADDASGAIFANFINGASVGVGSISRVGVTAAVAYNTSSDARLKTNIRDFTGTASGKIIDGLRPRLFDWKAGGNDVIGFIAQEENAVDPALARSGAVTVGDSDPVTIKNQWQRSDAALVPVLVAELKAVRARLTKLESSLKSK